VDDVFGINAITGSGDPLDDNDHGTHVSGTIGAAANDGNPHVGVTWHVRLMACKFLNDQDWCDQ
jgi:subtilisin family serine protease